MATGMLQTLATAPPSSSQNLLLLPSPRQLHLAPSFAVSQVFPSKLFSSSPSYQKSDRTCQLSLCPPFRLIRSSHSAPMRESRASSTAEASTAPSSTYEEFVDFAHSLADEARGIIPKYFRQPISIEAKSDESPVTIADREVERAVRRLISEKYPEHSILGEEEGVLKKGTEEVPEYLWVIDPIDGTASFITGKPLFGVLISLLHKGVPVLGILDQPILKERWVGVKGQQTTLNGVSVNSRRGATLSESYAYTTSPHLFPTLESNAAFERVRVGAKRINYGCDCYAFGLLALGSVDVALEFGVKPWDYMALVPIVKGSGGEVSDWTGDELRLHSLDSATWPASIVASGSPALQKEVLQVLSWEGEPSQS